MNVFKYRHSIPVDSSARLLCTARCKYLYSIVQKGIKYHNEVIGALIRSVKWEGNTLR